MVLLTALLMNLITTGITVGLLIKSSFTKVISLSDITTVLRWNTMGIKITGVSSTAGNASNQLNYPRDVVLAYPNLLYVADYQNHRVQKYVIGSESATIVAGNENGIGGISASQLNHPSRILIDSDGGVLVSDTSNNCVQYWNSSLSNGTTIADDPAGTTSNASNRLYYPYGLAYDSSLSALYISDYGNSRIMRYLSGSSSGTLIMGNNTPACDMTQLYYPVDLYFGSLSNSLVIDNHIYHNLVRWAFGAT